jgi:hypothetical protein
VTTLDELKQLRRNESAFYWRKQRFLFQSLTPAETHSGINFPPQLHGMDGKNKHWTFPVQNGLLEDLRIVRKTRRWANRRRFASMRVNTDVARATHPHEESDCTVHALAVAAGIPYADAHAFLKSRGRKDGQGITMWSYHCSNYDGEHGKFVPITSRVKIALNGGLCAAESMTVGKVLKSGLLPKRCIIGVKGHVFAVIDGVVHETARQCGSSKRVYDIMEFIPR